MLSRASRGALDDMALVAVSCRSRRGLRVGDGSYRGSLHALSPILWHKESPYGHNVKHGRQVRDIPRGYRRNNVRLSDLSRYRWHRA